MQPEGQSGTDNQRFDFAQIGEVEVLSTGALRIPAVLGRVGVVSYNRGGKVVRELRPPDEVFRTDSMKTFRGATATDLHPPRAKAFITPKNWKEHAVGYVEGDVRQDGDLLRGNVVVQDAEMIRMIHSGERKELSPGYVTLKSDPTPGRYDSATGNYGPDVTTGVPYDVVQRDIFNNSLGIGPRGWGRQGSAVALRLDSHAAASERRESPLGDFLTSKMQQMSISVADLAETTGILPPKEPEAKPLLRTGSRPSRTWILESILDGWTDRPSDQQLKALGKALDTPLADLIKLIPEDLQRLDGGANLNPQQASKTMDMTDIRLDGLTASVPKQSAEVINKAISERDSSIAERDSSIKALTDAASEGKARFDGLTEQLAAANKKLEELPGQLRTQIAARAQLETQAATVLGADFKLDGKEDREVRELVLQGIAKASGSAELKLDGEDDTYVRVRYDVALEGFKAPDASNKVMEALTGGKNPPAVNLDASDAPDPDAARKVMIERMTNASKPATATN